MGPPPSTDIGPGIGAFVAFFAMAVLLWLLMRNMNARMRRMAYRERDRVEALRAQEAAGSGERGSGAAGAGGAAAPGQAPDSGNAGTGSDAPSTAER